MTILQHTPPASLRPGASASRESRGAFALSSRPYLVSNQRIESAISTQQYLSLFPHEAEDARLTGSTRSLYRRLLALNLPGAATRFEAASDYTAVSIRGVLDGSTSKIA